MGLSAGKISNDWDLLDDKKSLERFKTRSEAMLKIVDYIVWYNAKRRHSYLGNISPLEFEKQYYQNILGEAA